MRVYETNKGEKMSESKLSKDQLGRRGFVSLLGGMCATTAVCSSVAAVALEGGAATAKATPARPEFPVAGPVPDNDWTKRRWAFGVDAERCIGCLRCVEACKVENKVPFNPNDFRTWVERYVYLEGEDKARVDSQADPVNIAAGDSPQDYRFSNRYRDQKVKKAFFVPKLCNHCEHPPCVQVCPVGATYKTPDGVVLIDEKYCIGCRYCVQACPYGARYFNEETQTTDKCTWCYHRITKGLKPACVEVCPVNARIFGDLNDPASDISVFIRTHRVNVLKAWTGNGPHVFYNGIDGEVS
jgi:Fe-S-cluster-containing dehydrogenase component